MKEAARRWFGGSAAALVIGLALVGCGVAPLAPPVSAPQSPLTAAAAAAVPVPMAAEPAPAVLAAPTEAAAAALAAEPAEPMADNLLPVPKPPPQVGIASWYGAPFHGRRTANGERYDMHALTAAHPTLPLRSFVHVRHIANRREVVLRINDRGPFKAGRIIDLSRAAARALGIVGLAQVEVLRLDADDARIAALPAAPAARGSKAVTAPAPRSVSASAARRPVRSG